MNLRTIIGALALIGFVLASPKSAEAKQHRYLGQHPVVAQHGGGFCHIEFPHVHAYAPHKAKILYRRHHHGYYFVGDPVAHGYEGDRHAYHGAHPIHVNEVVVSVNVETPTVDWCYIKGPHYHAHPPSAQATFEVKGDVHWYVGTYPPEFEKRRKAAVQINTVYAPMVYHRPTVVVKPPSAYVDVFIAAPPVPVPMAPVPVVAPLPPGPPVPVPGVGFVGGGILAPPRVHGHGHAHVHGHGHFKGPKHHKHKGHRGYKKGHKSKHKHKRGPKKHKGKHKR